jgi:hypothetical protein
MDTAVVETEITRAPVTPFPPMRLPPLLPVSYRVTKKPVSRIGVAFTGNKNTPDPDGNVTPPLGWTVALLPVIVPTN